MGELTNLHYHLIKIKKMQTTPQQLFTEVQQQTIVNAIKNAELGTSGEIRVHIESTCPLPVMERAIAVFYSLKMDNTELNNGVLVYVAIDAKKMAVQEYPLCFAIPCSPILPVCISSSEISMKCCSLGTTDNDLSAATFEVAINPTESTEKSEEKRPKKARIS